MKELGNLFKVPSNSFKAILLSFLFPLKGVKTISASTVI